MNLTQVKQFALAVGTKVASSSGDWAVCCCPLAPFTHDSGKDSHPSCAISYGDNIESAFNCYTCEAGSLFKLIQILRDNGAKAPKYDLKAAVQLWSNEDSGDTSMIFTEQDPDAEPLADTPWPEAYLDNFMRAWKVPMAMEYLQGRRVKQNVVLDLDIRWDLRRKAVCFPIRNWRGMLVGMRGRYLEDTVARYHDYDYRGIRNKLPWFGEHTINLDKPVLMVESVFDYASAYRVYKNILAPLTVGLGADKCKRVRNAFEIVTLFDNGVGGDKGRDKITKRLPESIITHLYCPKSKGVDDPGDMSKKQLRKVLKKHIVLDAC